MHPILFVSLAATLAIAAGGCSPADSGPPAPGGASSGGARSGGASSGGASTGGASNGGVNTGGASNGGTAGALATSYAKDVQPILMAKCGKCHAGQSQGHHNIANTYADAKKPIESLQFDECWSDFTTATGPKTVGECSMLLGRAGKMPASVGCDRPTPPDPSVCLTVAEKDTLAAWVAGGMAP